MIEDKKENQDPSQLSRKYGRRAKIAAWALGLPGVFGVAASAANAHPSNTKIEHIAAGQEAMTPQAFLDAADKKIDGIKDGIKSSPHLEVIAANKLNPKAPPDQKLYSTWAPNKDDPNHFDFIIMAISSDTGMPDYTALIMDADSNNWHHVKNTPKDYFIGNSKVILLPFPGEVTNPDFIQVVVPFGSSVNGYSVAVNSDSGHPHFGKAGTDGLFHPSTLPVVSGEFSKFFGIADEILASANQ